MRESLPFLIDLMDDESQEVKEEVLKAFNNYGFNLESDIKEFSDLLDQEKMEILMPIIFMNRFIWLKQNWNSWFSIFDDYQKLETAMALLTKFLYGLDYKVDLSHLLDELAEEFMNKYPYGNELDLSYFLFHLKNIKGEKENYYNPLNSSLVYAINNKRGIPITLCMLYMLVGDRAGFHIEGCNFPGHFLSKIVQDDEILFVDCYNDGRVIYESELESLKIQSGRRFVNLTDSSTSPEVIIRRVLNNLLSAFKKNDDINNSMHIQKIIELTPTDSDKEKYSLI
ncbi:transglutaminase-like domain-containing protein [Melioribacteraceae bacterium 4301-Me]|uniref:transglutaminase-like domain-containing protein n=1 Tax=Pyranulibacter aquaticus TaxID=3163344 RepID=UPI00359AF297